MRIWLSQIMSVDYDKQLYMPLALGQTKGLTVVSAPSPFFCFLMKKFCEEIPFGPWDLSVPCLRTDCKQFWLLSSHYTCLAQLRAALILDPLVLTHVVSVNSF